MELWAVILLAVCGLALLLMLVIALAVLLRPMNSGQRKAYQEQMRRYQTSSSSAQTANSVENPYLGKILLP